MSAETAPRRGLFRRFLREQVLPYWLLQTEIAICVAAQVVLELVDPLLLRAIVDRGLGDGDLSLVAVLAGILTVTLTFRVAFRIVSIWLYSYGGLRILYDLRLRAYEHVQSLSPYFLRGERYGDVLARLTSDIDTLQRAAVYSVVNGVQNVLVICGITTVLVLLDARLALVLAFVYPPLALVLWWLNRHVRRESEESREAIGGLYDFLEERLGLVRLIQTFRRERAQAKRLVGVSRPWIRSNLRLSVVSSMQISLSDVMLSGAPILVFLFGAARVLEGTLSLGTLIAFYTLAGRLHRPLSLLVDLNIELQMARAALRRVYELVDQEPWIREAEGARAVAPVTGRVALRHVDFAWEGAQVLSDLDVELQPGTEVALVGPSGAGKSTVAALLARFLDPVRGAVELDGLDLRQWKLADLRRAVCVVPQEAQLFHDTLAANLRVAAPRATNAELVDALHAAQLGPFLAALPDGLATLVGTEGMRLSGGERQRVALARALLARPRVLVLDEATSALDATTERLVLQSLRRRTAGCTRVVIAHRLTSLVEADRILVLERGRLVQDGAHGELVARAGVYRSLWEEHAAQGDEKV